MLFRNHLIGEFPDWFWEICSADYAIQLFITQHGKAEYLDNLEAVRLVHSQSFTTTVWKDMLIQNNLMIDDLLVFSENFPAKRQAIKASHLLTARYFYSARLSWDRNKYKDSLVYFFKYVIKDLPWIRDRINTRVKLLLRY